MLKFQWNALRRGHVVNVHDPANADLRLFAGVVAMVDAHVGRGGTNEVGIRVADDDGTTRIVWPSYVAVHLEPLDATEPCWRCQEIAARPPALRQCGRCRRMFPRDPTLPQGFDTGWWACDSCHNVLIGPGALAVPTWPPKVATSTASR